MAENKSKTTHGFKKGQSGNPGGRPKLTKEALDLVQACKDKTPSALGVIEKIMRSGETEKNRLAAAQYIIDRAYGKAVQQVDAQVGGVLDGRIEIVIVDPAR